MDEDISKSTVIVLLILTIMISVVGTLVVLEEAQRIRPLSLGNQEMQSFAGETVNPELGMIKVNLQRPPAEFKGGTE
ncbi:hypothetical protein COV19_07045 [Candidatus Woesearchaeota archaeon CG10_big_fil_rev_8_21_14_0_10_44_13]|nr:MAG: hypothetical protein COV19_07045 [Candidatus Woesearchaeota archaeon CG10_big_fil_rev_8_21_14_0_10_44_13]